MYSGTINIYVLTQLLFAWRERLVCFLPKNLKICTFKVEIKELDLATGETLHLFSQSLLGFFQCIFIQRIQLLELVWGLVSHITWACRKIFWYWIYCIYHLHTERERERARRRRRKDKDFVELMSSDSPLGGSAFPYWTLLWKEEIIPLPERQSGTCRLIVIVLQVLQLFWYQFHWCTTVCFCTRAHTHIQKR